MRESKRVRERERELWLCNVITALFNLSERDLSYFHNHHPSSQDSSHYFAGEPPVPHNEAKSAWDAARPPSPLPRSFPESSVTLPLAPLPRALTAVSGHRTALALASFCKLSCSVLLARAR